MAGLKHDEGKLDWHALPLELVELLVPVAVAGANKYGRHSILQTIEDAGPRHYSATMRHLSACQLDPLAIDPESGCYHAVHAAYDLLARVYQCERGEKVQQSAMDALLASASRVGVHNGPNGDSRVPMPEVYSGNITCPACSRSWPLGSEQGRSVTATGVCIVCRAEYERRERPRRAEGIGYTLPPLDDGDDDPAVHIVPDRTSRSVDDATASQMYERHKREMEQYRSND